MNVEPKETHETAFRLLSEAEVARMLAVSPFTVARLRKAGKIPFRKVSGMVRYHLSDVKKYVDAIQTIADS